MRRTATILALAALFSTAFVAGKAPVGSAPWHDSLPSVWFYTEGIKRVAIDGDTVAGRELLREAVRRDSTYAPAYYYISASGLHESAEEGLDMARRAHESDTMNLWYHQNYGQHLIMSGRYKEAQRVYEKLKGRRPDDPDTYRLLAALYQTNNDPWMALATLDSAELRFGRIELLGRMKRQLLLQTHQNERAMKEAEALVAQNPYDSENRVVLAEIYAVSNKDSLARVQFGEAMKLDSTDIPTLLALSDFQASRRDWNGLLATTRRLFQIDALPIKSKIEQFERLTADVKFYGQHYLQLNDLASTLAIRYPSDPGVVALYAGHLIASGETERAREHYKLHLGDRPAQDQYYHMVIDIESYLERPDSALFYVDRALELFPEKSEFHISKGNIELRSERYDRALEGYREALKYAPNDTLRSRIWNAIGDTHNQIAEAAANEKAARKAMMRCFKAYDESLRLWRDNASVLNNYAYFLSLEGRDLERALEMSSRVMALTDNNPTYIDTHAWVLYRLGRYDEAKRAIQQAVALDGGRSADILLHYGDILNALGESFTAEIYWRKALEGGVDPKEVEERFKQPKNSKK